MQDEQTSAGARHHGCGSCALNRRDFIASTGLAAVTALLAAACGDGQIGGATGPNVTVSGTVRLADYPALGTTGGIARIQGLALPVAVVRSAAATFRAFSLVCTHEGTTVNIVGDGFRCPNHLATFNASGQWTGGQPTSGLREFPVSYDSAAGTLRIG